MKGKELLDQIVRGLDGVTPGPWREDTHLGCIVGHKGEIISGAVNGAHIIATQPDAIREIAAYVRDLEERLAKADEALEEAVVALRRSTTLIDAMRMNDPNEPVSDAGHVASDLWTDEADKLDTICKQLEIRTTP